MDQHPSVKGWLRQGRQQGARIARVRTSGASATGTPSGAGRGWAPLRHVALAAAATVSIPPPRLRLPARTAPQHQPGGGKAAERSSEEGEGCKKESRLCLCSSPRREPNACAPSCWAEPQVVPCGRAVANANQNSWQAVASPSSRPRLALQARPARLIQVRQSRLVWAVHVEPHKARRRSVCRV